MQDMRIVVGVDFGEPSLTAVKWTARHYGSRAELVLAHALFMPEPPSFLRGLCPPASELIEDARRGAESRLQELRVSVDAPSVSLEVRVGRPDEVLLRVAEDRQAELIVIGPHDERPGVWKLLGSTAERVVRGSARAVLLARGLKGEGPRRVLLAIDESEARHQVLEWGARFARELNAEVIAVHVANPLQHGAAMVAGSPQERERAEGQMRERATSWMRAQLTDAGMPDAIPHVAFGDAGFEILSAVSRHRAELVVVGRHGAGGTAGAFMGSVPEFLLRNGTGSVLTLGGRR
jgi:nucleotide-binding universal stress UspA family protein